MYVCLFVFVFHLYSLTKAISMTAKYNKKQILCLIKLALLNPKLDQRSVIDSLSTSSALYGIISVWDSPRPEKFQTLHRPGQY